MVPQGEAFADFKKVGRTTAAGTINTILNGKGAPSASLGNNGDFYIDKVNMNFYGPKVKNAWPLPVSMRGPAGPAGNDGKNGVDGKNGTNGTNGTTTVATTGSSSPGATGATGPAGPEGPAGPAGPKGDTGPAGPQGATGLSGAAGPAGPAGAQGDTGATGAQGPVGPQGPTGPTGSQGLKGDAGSSGVTSVKHGTISFDSINTNRGGASAKNFGSFLPGKSYFVQLLIYANLTGGEAVSIGFDMPTTSGVSFNYITGSSLSGRTASDAVNESFIVANIVVDGAVFSGTDLQAIVKNYSFLNGSALTIKGTYEAIQVDSLL